MLLACFRSAVPVYGSELLLLLDGITSFAGLSVAGCIDAFKVVANGNALAPPSMTRVPPLARDSMWLSIVNGGEPGVRTVPPTAMAFTSLAPSIVNI